ncbi:MAG: serine/threonine-protein kinase [bacterium]|nr:serine/threonine-protein kinase [bacterium]
MSTTGIVATPLDAPTCMHCNAPIDKTLTPLTETTCPSCGEKIMVPGRLGQQYRLIRLIGAGGMGAVYEGFDDGLCRKIAVKVILREKAAEDPSFIENFRREAQSAAKLNSPNIVAIYAFGEAEGQPYLVMELVQPDALDKMMASGPVMPATALNICMQIAQGLRAASEQGLVHGDVKPENILINEAREAKLADFGIAALSGASAAANNEVWGTPYYIAPETLRKQKIDLRADIYSLGGTLYHAIAGVPPFEGADAVEVMKARLLGPARPITEFCPSCPEGIAKIVMRMLEPELIRRYPNYDSLLNDMRKELRSAQSSIGGGKRIVLKGKNVTGPVTTTSIPIVPIRNVNAPLVEKKSHLGLWVGLGLFGFISIVVASILLLVMAGGDKETPDQVNATVVATPMEDPTVEAAATARAELTTLREAAEEEMRKLVVSLKTSEDVLKTLRSNAQSVAWETELAWLEPTEEPAPTQLLQSLQTAYQTVDLLETLKKTTEKHCKALSKAEATVPTESVDVIDAHVKSVKDEWKAFKESAEFKSYPSKVRALDAMDANATLNAMLAKARQHRDAMHQAKLEAAAAAEQAAKAAEQAAKEAEQAAKDVENVKSRLETYVMKDVEAFNLEEAKKEYDTRLPRLRLKSEAGTAAANVIANRIAVLADFKTWTIAAVTKGSFKTIRGCILTDATEATIKVNGVVKSWPDFLKSREVLTFYKFLLLDEASSRQRFGLAPSQRAELCVGALYMMDLFIGVEARQNSKTLQNAYKTLLDVAQGNPKSALTLEGLQLDTTQVESEVEADEEASEEVSEEEDNMTVEASMDEE